MSYSWISFLTDYGVEDGFVAACHGVIGRIAPTVRVVDVTHAVPPQDVRRGAAVLAQTLPYLPPAVHVGVVDPGVGTVRRAVAVAAGDSVLVGPDNGLLVEAAEALGGVRAVRELTNEELFVRPVSRTFHGRDIFCPVAAHLATGTPLDEVGPVVDPATLERLAPPYVSVSDDGRSLAAEVVAVDHFGNLQLPVAAIPPAWQPGDRVAIADGRGATAYATVGRTFGDVPAGELVVFVDSAGFVAIAANGGRADRALGVASGATVHITASSGQ